MALECGCIARICTYCDDGLRVILHQSANLVLHLLNGYYDGLPPNMRMQPTPFRRQDRTDFVWYNQLQRHRDPSGARLMRHALGGHERPIGLMISA